MFSIKLILVMDMHISINLELLTKHKPYTIVKPKLFKSKYNRKH